MVTGRQKSRTFRRVHRRKPGGKTVLHYKKRKPSKAKCGRCGDILKGIKSERPYKMQNMAKTKKTVSRPYGGNLCSKCMRAVIKEKIKQ